MGTPGDRSRYRTISDSKATQLEDHSSNDDNTTTASIATQSTSTSTASATIIKNEPPSSLLDYGDEVFVGSGAVKLEPYEQTYIDDYYPEHKFSQTLIFKSKNPQQTETDIDLHAAGPSGLQTPPKSSSRTRSTNVAAAKKLKKPTIKKQYVCSVCQKCFQNPNKLAKHQQIHGINSPFKCEHCKKSFSSKFKLVRHALIHSDRKPFSCTICERTFHRKDHLKNHIKVHSPCKKLYVCEKSACKKEYTSLISYKKHLAFHDADDGILDCRICEKSFQTKEEILYHLKVHAGSRTVKNPDEKKYSCDHCDRKFFTRKDVRRHMVVHTGRRDFLCQFCPQRFGRKDHLVRHIKKSHSETSTATATTTSELSETIVKSEVPEPSCSSSTPIAPTPPPSTSLMVIKTEEADDESNLSADVAENLNLDFDSLLAASNYLPEPHTQGELTDLGCEVLDVIPPDEMVGPALDAASVPASNASDDDLFEGNVLALNDSMMLDYLNEDRSTIVRENAPLPAFSQIFQHQQQPSSQQPKPPSPR